MIITIEYKGAMLDVEGKYYEAETCVYYYKDGSGYPGASAEFEIIDILKDGVSVLSLLEEYLYEIENLILENYESN